MQYFIIKSVLAAVQSADQTRDHQKSGGGIWRKDASFLWQKLLANNKQSYQHQSPKNLFFGLYHFLFLVAIENNQLRMGFLSDQIEMEQSVQWKCILHNTTGYISSTNIIGVAKVW